MIADTLTRREMEFEGSGGIRWRPLSEANEPNHDILILTRHAGIVIGWMSENFLGRKTFWSWDERAAIKLSNGRIMPGCVEALSFAEIRQ